MINIYRLCENASELVTSLSKKYELYSVSLMASLQDGKYIASYRGETVRFSVIGGKMN